MALKLETLNMLNIPHEWKYKIEKVTYVVFNIETEESYKKGLEVERLENEETKKTGKIYFDCNHIPNCGSISIKADISNYERIIEEKYEEFKVTYGGRLRSIQLI